MTHSDPSSSPHSEAVAAPLPGERPWRLAVDDATLSGFERADGDGPAGLFLHGFRSHCDGEKSRHLSLAAGRLACPWLRYDQRACGGSSGDFRRFTLSRAIEDAAQVLEAWPRPSYVLVGSSLGGLIAVHLTQSRRFPIAGLVLIAPALRFTQHFIHDHLDATALATWRRRGYRWFPDLYAGGCYRLDYDFCADALHYGEPPAELPCPVRVLHGSRDELLPWQDSRDWVAGLDCPGRALEIIDGGDHRLSDWSDVIGRQFESLVKEVRQSCA